MSIRTGQTALCVMWESFEAVCMDSRVKGSLRLCLFFFCHGSMGVTEAVSVVVNVIAGHARIGIQKYSTTRACDERVAGAVFQSVIGTHQCG